MAGRIYSSNPVQGHQRWVTLRAMTTSYLNNFRIKVKLLSADTMSNSIQNDFIYIVLGILEFILKRQELEYLGNWD